VWEFVKLRGIDIDHDVFKSGVTFTISTRLERWGSQSGKELEALKIAIHFFLLCSGKVVKSFASEPRI
jgi:hypothetical protein